MVLSTILNGDRQKAMNHIDADNVCQSSMVGAAHHVGGEDHS